MTKLYMLLLGSSPAGRNIEQHDIFFGIADSVKELIPQIKTFWPVDKLHVDAFRVVTLVNGFAVKVVESGPVKNDMHLFFINLGGYKQNEFEEFHYKMLVAAPDKGAAIQQSKETAFYKHTGFKGAPSHVDDKYGVDVDDVFEIADILPDAAKKKYSIHIAPATKELQEDVLYLGYFKLDTVDMWDM